MFFWFLQISVNRTHSWTPVSINFEWKSKYRILISWLIISIALLSSDFCKCLSTAPTAGLNKLREKTRKSKHYQTPISWILNANFFYSSRGRKTYLANFGRQPPELNIGLNKLWRESWDFTVNVGIKLLTPCFIHSAVDLWSVKVNNIRINLLTSHISSYLGAVFRNSPQQQH